MKSKRWIAGIVVVAALVAWDIDTHQFSVFFVGPVDSQDAPTEEPLQVQNLPLLRPGTLTLGEGNPTVVIAASIDAELPKPAPIDADLSYEQVDAIVRRALDLDQSGASIRDVIKPEDWVVLKVNSVSNRGDLGSEGDCCSRYTHDGTEHPGQITDLRVVKSVIAYLIQHVGPKRITIAEGGSGSPRRDKAGFPSYAVDDSWSATYPEFADLSYMKILEEFAAVATVVDTADLNYAPWRIENVPGGAIARTSVTRSTYDGAQYGYHEDGSGRFRRGFAVAAPILDADKVISIPAMKTTIYGTTLGIKNYVGVLAPLAYGSGIGKGAHAQNNPEQGYVDLFSYNPAAYTVIEGFWSTEGNGPQRGDNVQHNLVVVGSDPVATEAIANVTMGYHPLDLEVLYLAAVKGFGTLDLDRITVLGREPETVQHNFVKSRAVSATNGETFYYGRGIRRWLVAGPFDDADLDEPHIPGAAGLRPREGEAAGSSTWTRVEHLGYSAERLVFSDVTGDGADVVNYAYTSVMSRAEQEGFLWFGFDEVARAWLNGEVVYSEDQPRDFALADEHIPVILRGGENRLMFKIGNIEGRTEMSAHVVDEDGDRLPGIDFVLPSEVVSTAVEGDADQLPGAAALYDGYPNPFNPATHLRFAIPESGPVHLAVYNSAGQRVVVLVDGQVAAGEHMVVWDGRDASGANAASGVYYVRMRAGIFEDSKAVTRVR